MTTPRKFNLEPRSVEKVYPYVIEGKDAPAIFGELERLIKLDFNDNPNLKVLKMVNGVLRGSSPLILPLVNQVVSPHFSVMKPERVEQSLQEGDPIGITGSHNVYYGIVLDFSGRDNPLALEFHRQLPQELGFIYSLPNCRDLNLNSLPALITGYGLTNSKIGPYGVCPTFIEGTTRLRKAQILAGKEVNLRIRTLG